MCPLCLFLLLFWKEKKNQHRSPLFLFFFLLFLEKKLSLHVLERRFLFVCLVFFFLIVKKNKVSVLSFFSLEIIRQNKIK